MPIKYTSWRISFFNIMNNSSVTVEAGFVWAFQYVTQFESWLRPGLPQFCRCKFHKPSGACGKDADC